jgi:hypothetical protein
MATMFPASSEDHEVQAKRVSVVIAVTIVLVVSNVSYALRIWARKRQAQSLEWDDYIMGLALPFSYIPAACLYYGEL